MSEPVILCEGLVKIYKVADLEVLALQGLDLSVQKGELMGIVGVSGSGKSTLMNVLGGLARPSAGKVIVDGQNLLTLSESAMERYRRSQVGFVWQMGARNLISYLDIQENVEFPMMLAGIRQSRQRAGELLDMVGLSERRKHYPSELSGGEQLRVAIAISLANKPVILLADEPTGELDTSTAQKIYDAFRTLNRELGLTILIVSHDPAIARQVNRVVAIRDGQVATETVRRKVGYQASANSILAVEEDHYEEMTVMDKAGRLQIPKSYREKLKLGKRVRLELVEHGVLIHPISEDQSPITIKETPVLREEKGIWKNLLHRFTKNGEK